MSTMLAPRMDRLALIDIGSNTVRLVVMEYVLSTHSRRLLDESKQTIRLAGRMQPDGTIPLDSLADLAQILKQYKRIGEAYRVGRMRAVATAAIRNATNREQIIAFLESACELTIEVLSGEAEARVGFVGAINTVEARDGFVVDIGGGSTEVSFFANRQLVHSASLPIGAVNAAKHFSNGGAMVADQISQLTAHMETYFADMEWLGEHPGLPLIGLGGTCRTCGKIDQARRKYSFPVIHHYHLPAHTIEELTDYLSSLTADERREVENLGKDRADLIVPGLMILLHLIRKTNATGMTISGSGLRDGLFAETVHPVQPVIPDVPASNVTTMLTFFPPADVAHEQLVQRTALRLYELFAAKEVRADERIRRILTTSALLYAIGRHLNFYQYYKHTYYLLTQSRMDGLPHRDIVLIAMIAAGRGKNRCKDWFAKHRDVLHESDLQTALRLGTLLQVAILADRDKHQTLVDVNHSSDPDSSSTIRLDFIYQELPPIDAEEWQQVIKEIRKHWNVDVNWRLLSSSSHNANKA